MERRLEIVLGLFGFLLGGVLIAFLLAPRVISFSPTEYNLSAWSPIIIDFNQSIDEQSFSDRFHILPQINGQLSVDGNRISFRPLEPLAYGQTYTVTIRPGVRGTRGLPLFWGFERNFTIAQPRVVFLREKDGVSTLMEKELNNDSMAREIIADDIWDYQVINNGVEIIYSAFDQSGSTDIWRHTKAGEEELILDCENVLCQSARMQPLGHLLAFERSILADGQDEVEVWLMDTNNGQIQAVHDPSLLESSGFDSSTSHSPRWSADGRYLAYFKPDARVIVIFDTEDDSSRFIPANLEIMGDWSPISYSLAYSELAFADVDEHDHDNSEGEDVSRTRQSLANHTILANLELNQTIDLSSGLEASDGKPIWHPSGDTLATSRSAAGAGRQIWVIPIDGAGAYPITDEPLFNHTALSWSPNGNKIAYMRSVLDNTSAPEIWIKNLETGHQERLTSDGYLPMWLP